MSLVFGSNIPILEHIPWLRLDVARLINLDKEFCAISIALFSSEFIIGSRVSANLYKFQFTIAIWFLYAYLPFVSIELNTVSGL